MIFGRKGNPPATESLEALRPLAVLANGRSGGTILLEALSRHPELVVCPRWPHEQRPATYVAFAHASLRLVEAVEPSGHEPAKSVYENGRSPFSSREEELERDYAESVLAPLAAAARAGVSDFYRRLARSLGKAAVRGFAEKVYVNLMVEFARQWPNACMLLLVRDPRDAVVSASDFFYREGDGAAPRAGRSQALAELLAGNYGQAWTRLPARLDAARAAGVTVHIVRYEELLTATEAALTQVAQWAGLSVDGVAAMASAFREEPQRKSHLTSESPQASIGRWRRDLDAPLRAELEQALRPAARALGYE